MLASELGKISNQVYGDQYNRERANMMGATQLAPQLAQADYADIEALGGVGQTRESMDMAKIQDAMARFDFEQQKPYYKLREYLGSIGSSVPQTTSVTKPTFRNTGTDILSGAASGYQLGQNFGMGGIGAAAGGLLGGFF